MFSVVVNHINTMTQHFATLGFSLLLLFSGVSKSNALPSEKGKRKQASGLKDVKKKHKKRLIKQRKKTIKAQEKWYAGHTTHTN